MKTLLLPILALLALASLPLPGGDLPATFDRLETLSGKVYEKAKVTHVELDVAIVSHVGGVARIPAADLAEEVRAKIPFDLAGAEKAKAEKAAAETAAKKEADLDRLYPAYDVEVTQVVEGGVLCFLARSPAQGDPAWYNRHDLQFVELDAEGLGLVDGQRVKGLRLEKLDAPYTFETVLGARATVPRWRHYAAAGFAPRKPLTPEQLRSRSVSPPGGQGAVNRLFGR